MGEKAGTRRQWICRGEKFVASNFKPLRRVTNRIALIKKRKATLTKFARNFVQNSNSKSGPLPSRMEIPGILGKVKR